jgi:SEC-C motif-containing protein
MAFAELRQRDAFRAPACVIEQARKRRLAHHVAHEPDVLGAKAFVDADAGALGLAAHAREGHVGKQGFARAFVHHARGCADLGIGESRHVFLQEVDEPAFALQKPKQLQGPIGVGLAQHWHFRWLRFRRFCGDGRGFSSAEAGDPSGIGGVEKHAKQGREGEGDAREERWVWFSHGTPMGGHSRFPSKRGFGCSIARALIPVIHRKVTVGKGRSAWFALSSRPMSTIPFADAAALEAYCLPFIRGEKKPQTAVETMASRYVAYTLVEVDYLLSTHDPRTRAQADRQSTEDWARRAKWESLEVLKTEGGGPEDDEGKVEFIARYQMDGKSHVHHELSDFKRIDGQWYFVDGKKASGSPTRRTEAKVGRNDPCTCGSGKKFKKCCGAASA